LAAQTRLGLGLGELSTVFLAKEIGATLVLMDEARGRRFASGKSMIFEPALKDCFLIKFTSTGSCCTTAYTCSD